MKREIRLDIVYPHPPERVWKALTDPRSLAKWMMPNDFLPRLGHRFRFVKETPLKGRRKPKRDKKPDPDVVECEVVELDAPRRLAYTWRSDPDSPPDLVSWTLEQVESGTRLRLEHIALDDPAIVPTTPITAQVSAGWPIRLTAHLPLVLRGLKRARRHRAIRLQRGQVRVDASTYAPALRLESESEVSYV